MKFTAEQMKKAAACKNADELIALAKSEGIELAKAEAEKYIAALTDGELNVGDLSKIAGGMCIGNVCGSDC